MSDRNTQSPPRPQDQLDLRAVGMNELAYLRPGQMDGMKGFAICAANGAVIGFAPSWNQAVAAIMQNDMELVTLH
jgi:hypothetical protein